MKKFALATTFGFQPSSGILTFLQYAAQTYFPAVYSIIASTVLRNLAGLTTGEGLSWLRRGVVTRRTLRNSVGNMRAGGRAQIKNENGRMMKTTQGRRDVMKRSSLLFEGGKGKIPTKKKSPKNKTGVMKKIRVRYQSRKSWINSLKNATRCQVRRRNFLVEELRKIAQTRRKEQTVQYI